MSEKKLQWKTVISMCVVVLCASLYSFGGMEYKFLRRFLAPFSAAVYLAIISKDPLQLIKAPLLILASSLGYGADSAWLKIIKRAYVGLAFGLGASITDIIKKKWVVVAYSMVAIVSVFIVYGVLNPVPARVEESLLGLIIYAMAILPSIKEN